MMRHFLFVLCVSTTGCNLFGAEEDKSNGAITPGTGGTTGTGGSAMGGGGGGSGGSAACDGLPGPNMVVVPAPSGTKYCVDRTEVTQTHYQQFLASTKTTPGTEHADCSENASYAPAVYPSSKEGATCITDVSWNPQKTPQRPVVCIDWCDAQAYCQWAGKRLCGKIGGGRLTITGGVDVPGDPANDASQSQWFNACSQGGKTAYPYGAAYDPAACESAVTTENWQQSKKDVGARPGCHGAQQPWSSLRDLSGSVAEMTDECVLWTDPAKYDDKPTVTCAQRGGSVVHEESWLGCALVGTTSPYTAYPDIGFRCCKDL